MTDHSEHGISRRNFIKTTGLSMAAFSILPSHTVYGLGHPAPSSKLSIAAIGVGGIGFRNLNNLKNENIVALCDVDGEYAQKSFRRWTSAHQYNDYRTMLDTEKDIDAVIVATPDHLHGVMASAVISRQKHLFLQTPITHSIYELKRLSDLAEMYGVATQMGNAVASSSETRLISEIIWSGQLGEVSEVHAWAKEPSWQQVDYIDGKRGKVPSTLNWELFLGPLQSISYHRKATPTGWKGMWNFGNGALGYYGSQILEPAFRALKLEAPISAEASSTFSGASYTPDAAKLQFEFAKRDNLPKVGMPAVKLFWYDGGLRPARPKGLPESEIMGDSEGGLLFIGSEGLLMCGMNGSNPKVYFNREIVNVEPKKLFPRIDNPFSGGHEYDWVRACKESPENRLDPSSSLKSQQPISETILVGSMAIRLQQINRKLIWNSAQMRFENLSHTDKLTFFETKEDELSNIIALETDAVQFVERLVRPVFRSGWEL